MTSIEPKRQRGTSASKAASNVSKIPPTKADYAFSPDKRPNISRGQVTANNFGLKYQRG